MKLSSIEKRLQHLVEGVVKKVFPSSSNALDLVTSLLQSMQDGVYLNSDGSYYAPNLYILSIHPEQTLVKETQDVMLSILAQRIHEAGLEAGYKFSSPPVVRIKTDPSIQHGNIQVTAQDSQKGLTATYNLPIQPGNHNTKLPSNAFLIIDGTETVNLNTPIVNIGRRADNHIVLKDSRVSRIHAQMRAVRGRYWIFDLDSSSGTIVNGQTISQKELRPGDVIMIGGVPLVYGEDNPAETKPVTTLTS